MKNEITITRKQFFEFVKSKEETEESSSPEYFLKYFDNYQQTGKKAGWNLAALFWSFVWFFYRGMYFYGFIMFLFLLTPAFLVKYFHPGNETIENLFICADIVVSVVCMRYANYFYLLYANQKISAGHLNKETNIFVAIFVIILYPLTITKIVPYIYFYLIMIPFVLLYRNRE